LRGFAWLHIELSTRGGNAHQDSEHLDTAGVTGSNPVSRTISQTPQSSRQIQSAGQTLFEVIGGNKFAAAANALALFLTGLVLLAAQGCAPSSDEAQSRHVAERVKTEFLHAWHNYERYAWGHDALKPLSKTPHDWYGQSLQMTPVDALDTLVLMKLDAEADKARALIATDLSFDRDIYVKNFEITIRLLGGLLSGYQLTGDKCLLDLADNLGTRLLPAFNSPTGLPYVFVNLRTGQVRDPVSNPAETGTLLLEFGALGKLTGKSVYYDKAKPTSAARRSVWSAPALMSRRAPGQTTTATSAAGSIPTTSIFGSAGSCLATKTASQCGTRAFPPSINIWPTKRETNCGMATPI
jgi:hypothetical protein